MEVLVIPLCLFTIIIGWWYDRKLLACEARITKSNNDMIASNERLRSELVKVRSLVKKEDVQ